jgi:dihydroorotate dehydrogenase electron transfer subunit
MSSIVFAEIIQNNEIAQGIYKLCLKIPADFPQPDPGQFVNLYLNDKSHLLPRPFAVCDWVEGTLTIVYAVVGDGTKIMSDYDIGVKVRITTPLGKGFKIESSNNCVVVGGEAGAAPLLFLAKTLSKNNQTKAMLGFKSEPFLTDEFPCHTEISTDDGTVGCRGNVIEMLDRADIPAFTQLFACGPKPMLRALTNYANECGLELQVSLDEHMGCGYGACVGCVCKTINGNRKVCEDGPVFDAKEVIWDA